MQDLRNERANPKGENPVDFQASEPQSGWVATLNQNENLAKNLISSIHQGYEIILDSFSLSYRKIKNLS